MGWEELKKQFKESDPVGSTEVDLTVQIVIARKNRDWSQRKLAEMAGVPQATIARMEKSISVPRLDTLIKICEVLDLEISITPKGERESVLDTKELIKAIKEESYGCHHRGETQRAAALDELCSKIERGLFDAK